MLGRKCLTQVEHVCLQVLRNRKIISKATLYIKGEVHEKILTHAILFVTIDYSSQRFIGSNLKFVSNLYRRIIGKYDKTRKRPIIYYNC